ncbi:ATP-binding protein [Blastococcus tunisiensis]|uniref:Regulatory protein, luxR family n=1 Tax=Blastococcus tunisiensis TaxID=1798228 RepID=A0A1I2B284_9ACTN|nr:helix-turn-helix transcriptional regulator [Blastococcus sp. DSM 46838]SFE49373.1 regulatory protein, luxR family [Blastococcus sp. DSM 46838]
MSGWAPPPLPARWASPARPAFVGRWSELAAFEEVWAAVLAGSRQVVFVGGEPGAGKSRLLAEVATTLHRHGAAVLVGTCAAEFGPPYQPFGEPLGALLGARPEAGLDDRLATLAGRGSPEDGDGPSHEYRRALYDAAVDAVCDVAAGRPLVLALEDLHWAGPSALQLLAHLVERTADCPLLLLGTHRTTAPDRSAGLVRTIAQLYRLDGVRRLDLAGLAAEDIAQYLVQEGHLSPYAARGAATVLRDQTGGNPFFLRELWRDHAAHGGRDLTVRQAPASVRDTILGRLERLPLPARQTVELAAVVGEDVDVATVLAASEWSRETTLAGLDEAVAFGLLEPVPPSDDVLRFPHALCRQAVLDLLPASRRLQQHAGVARAVESTIPASERRTQRLAFHYAQAQALGHAAEAVRYLTEAARSAARGLAHEDAAGWFEQAAALSEDDAGRGDLVLSAAGSHLLAGDFARARVLAERVATGSAEPGRRLAAAVAYEDASWRPGLPGHRAVELLEDALAGIAPDPADPHYVRGLASLGRALAFTGATVEADVLGRRAVDLARQHGDDDLLAHALQAGLWNGLRPEDAPDKFARAGELARLADRTGTLAHLGPAAYYRGVISYLQGEPDALAQAHDDLVRMARATGQTFFEYMAGCMSYARQFSAGDFAAAHRTCGELQDLGTSFGSDDTEGPCAVQSYMIRRESGTVGQVRGLITGDERPEEHWAPGLLALYTELELPGPAARLLAWLLDGRLARYEDSAQWPCVLIYAVEAALFLEDDAAARALRPRMAEYAGTNLVAGQFVAVFGSADRYLGALDSLLGGPAEEELAAALAMDTRMGSALHQAHTLAAQAVHARRSGAGAAVLDDLTGRARRLAEPLGLRRVLRLLGGTAPPVPAPRSPGGLTSRETEVLQLLGEGLLNREIADRLVISENTAANHVRSILAKTGSGNRTQAAMFAAAHGLLE